MTACEWNLIGLIGEGACSKVFLAENKTDLKRYALKFFCRDTQSGVDEAAIVSKIQHDSIVELKEVVAENALSFSDAKTEEEFQKLNLHGGYTMEYAAHSDFLNLIMNLGALPDVVARSYAWQLVDALEYLRDQGIAHGELTLSNLLLDENYCLKVSDFGAAKVFSEGTSTTRKAEDGCHFAPERIAEREYDAFSADVFSVGMTIFELVCGYSPFEKANLDDDLYSLIVQGNWDEFWGIHEEICSYNYITLSADFKELIQSLMNADPAQRLAMNEIKNSKWMKKAKLDRSKVGSWIQEIAKKRKATSVLSPVSSA